ncbi:TetR/AcrR family transcriptional regulator [Niveispirillum fermenti]|uniref:TetR/AcrR family transcriptional regulator n=1 Tax=Niveispirillum fermenti TaxID=1233113 RepID=UPI003A8BDD16
MPVAVDSGQRRTEVAAAAADLIIEGGLNAVTFRNLATRLGCSTTVISHFFRDKNEVLLETYRYNFMQAVALREQALAGLPADPVRAMEELLPVGPDQRRHWIIWLCFWTAALFEPGLSQEHQRGLVGTRERLRTHFIAAGMADPAADQRAEDICKALYGIAMQTVFDQSYWTAERQRAAFRRAAGGD